MTSPPETVVIEETSFEVEEKRGPNRWLVFGTLVFIIAFVLGWRSVRSKKSDATGAGTGDSSA